MGWIEAVKGDAALAAGLVSGVLFIFLCIRSPRNLYGFLLTAILGCICQWSLTEWFYEQAKGAQAQMVLDGVEGPEAQMMLDDLTAKAQVLHAFMMVGGVLLIPFYLHFALLLSTGVRQRSRWLAVAYGTALAFLLTIPLAAFTTDFYGSVYAPAEGAEPWDWAYSAFLAAVVGAGIVVLGRRYFGASKSTRGVFGFPLLAGIVLGTLGALDVVANLEGVANVGATAVAIIFVVGVFRYRGIFDSLTTLRESTDRLLGALNRGVVTFDNAGTVIHANEAAHALLGAEVRTFRDAGPEIEALVKEGGERMVQRGAKVLKVSVFRPEGPLGPEEQAHLLVEDVTRESQLLRDLAQRESLALLGEATATLTHEIRNPLTAIRPTLDKLTAETPPTLEQMKILRQEFARLSAVLERGLTLARPLEIDMEPSDLPQLLRRILKAPTALPVRLEAPDAIPPVPCDPELIRNVLTNLLINAEEAGAEEVTIRVVADEAAGQAVVHVSNRGPRIPDEILERMFEPFVTTKQRGGGLGLPLCRKIVTAHGGTIDARNTDVGVEFEVRLPWTF
ncbi:MAG: ATP-binding protein [Planctomycetota bacterium]|nr:ATP-binding protein [Planctomycetota bacterium]